MDGIIVINKEKEYTSHDVVAKLKKKLNISKVGHTGTLDPNATGVLPILIGKGTKFSKYLINHDKIYEVELELGKKTDTADIEGKVIEEKNVDEKYIKENLLQVLESFVGKQEQIPPMYSAIKKDGKKLYEYARAGEKVEIEPRKIEIYKIDLNKYDKKSLFIDFNLNPNKKVVLFFGGGEFGLGKNYTLKVFETFVKDSADIQIIAISGKNRKMKEAFENIVIENHKEANVQIFEYTNKVPEFMSISSLVVTKPGGLTTSESLASGLPIVVINPIPGQEEENAEYLVNHNTAIWLKKDDNVEEIINNLLSDSSKLEEMSNNARSISKPNSTNDICKILLNN